ncbi:hypothetical protein DB346_06565 [Verrucomicrobia bacterium LW23]|nr:hypothetical protein DB346_06565 [Verrucomicrobia bacterium LW23]
MNPRLPQEYITTLRILTAFFGAALVIWATYLIAELCGARESMAVLLDTANPPTPLGHTPGMPADNTSLAYILFAVSYFALYVAAVMVAPVLVLTGIIFAFAVNIARRRMMQ